MPKRPPKYTKPPTLARDFNEALGRVSIVDEKDIAAVRDDRVKLVERDGAAHPLLIYATSNGIRVDLPYRDRTLWASQQQMADMFGVDRNTVSEHLVNIYKQGELIEPATSRKIREVRLEGQRQVNREIPQYNLNAIISVGYRVGSVQGTMFRVWATERLIEILTKGFYVDKERLLNHGEPDALDEFKSIARQIRTSVRNSYREV